METSAQSAGEQPVAIRLLLACGAIGPLLNMVVILILGAARPHYSAWQIPDSSLELGEGGWIQITNYIVTGALLVGFAIGLRRVLRTGRGSTWRPILLGIYGLTFIGAGIFVTDPVLGYPPGASSTPTTEPFMISLASFSSSRWLWLASCWHGAMPPILPGAAGPGICLPQVSWSPPLMSSSSSPSNWMGQQDSLNGLVSLADAVGSLCWRSA